MEKRQAGIENKPRRACNVYEGVWQGLDHMVSDRVKPNPKSKIRVMVKLNPKPSLRVWIKLNRSASPRVEVKRSLKSNVKAMVKPNLRVILTLTLMTLNMRSLNI